MSSFDQADGQLQKLPQFGFAGGHLTLIDLVIHPGEVQKTVEQKDANLVREGVPVLGGLALRGLEGDGKIARVPSTELRRSGKAEDVGGFVFGAVLAIEAAESGVACQQDFYLADQADGGLGLIGEAGEADAGKSPRSPGIGVRTGASWRLDGDHAPSMLSHTAELDSRVGQRGLCLAQIRKV